ncbi:MAG: hypothetical protein V1848_03850 [Candidatus Magasanikbacteria bacterium]
MEGSMKKGLLGYVTLMAFLSGLFCGVSDKPIEEAMAELTVAIVGFLSFVSLLVLIGWSTYGIQYARRQIHTLIAPPPRH